MPNAEYRVVRRREMPGETYEVFLVQEESDATYKVRSPSIAFAAQGLDDLNKKLERLQSALARPVLAYDSLHFPELRKPSRVEALHNTTSVIPQGWYCYTSTKAGDLVCPYLTTAAFRPEQSSGYCWFMSKGDWDLKMEGHAGLLWDKVKECGVNPHVTSPEEETAHHWVFAALDAFIEAHPGVDSVDLEFRVDSTSGRIEAIVEAINHIEDRTNSPLSAQDRHRGRSIMRLYTIQETNFWSKCQEVGGIFIERQFIDEEFFLRSYEWMRRQVAKRLPADSGDFPVWAWAERPDLRKVSWKVKGFPFVLLTIDVPLDRVLLSDFGDWHIILNDGYLPIDDADFECELESPATQEKKEASWERIFDVNGRRYDSDGRIQACVDRVYLHGVISVRPFKSVVRGPIRLPMARNWSPGWLACRSVESMQESHWGSEQTRPNGCDCQRKHEVACEASPLRKEHVERA